jgi:hypothetical protein
MNIDLNELLTQELRDQFVSCWSSPEEANREVRRIMEILADPQSDTEEMLASLVIGLTGEKPDLPTWIRAFLEGDGFLRPRSKKGTRESPVRVIDRSLEVVNAFKVPASPAEALHQQERDTLLRIVTAVLLYSKLSAAVAAKAAMGAAAWPLMVAVDDSFSALEKWQLHKFGGEDGFSVCLAAAVRDGLTSWVTEKYDGTPPPYNFKAPYKSSLPPGVDPAARLDREQLAVARYRAALFPSLELTAVEPTLGLNPETVAQGDAAVIQQSFQRMTQPSRFSYWRNRETLTLVAEEYSPEEEERLYLLFPLLQRSGVADLIAAAGARAIAREIARSHRVATGIGSETDMIEEEVAELVRKYGALPPPNVRLQDVALFEEEACYYYADRGSGWVGFEKWRASGLFPDLPDAAHDPAQLWNLATRLARPD